MEYFGTYVLTFYILGTCFDIVLDVLYAKYHIHIYIVEVFVLQACVCVFVRVGHSKRFENHPNSKSSVHKSMLVS